MSTEVRVIRPRPFNCNDGPEAGPEAKGQTTTTYEPLSASGTPILCQVSPGHRKPATQPTIKTQHPRGHTTHTFNKATVVHATANLGLVECVCSVAMWVLCVMLMPEVTSFPVWAGKHILYTTTPTTAFLSALLSVSLIN